MALFLRLWKLQLLPIGISYVELDYIINAKSIWLSGLDISHSWSPLSLKALDSREILAELPSLLLSPFIGIAKLSLLNARLANAWLHSLSVFLIYALSTKLFKDKKISLIAALVYAINPWTLHFGRTAYEVSFGLISLLLFWLVLLSTKGWRILWSFPFIFLAFFTYHGFKFLVLPFALITILFTYLRQKKPRQIRPSLSLLIMTCALVGYFLVSFSGQSAMKRKGEIVFFNQKKAAESVNKSRRQTIPNQLMTAMDNKVSFMARDFTQRYLAAFSVPYWFINGDVTGVGGHTLWAHGYFYYLDLVLAVIGFVVLFREKRKIWWLLTGLLLISPLPSAVSSASHSYVHRSSLMVPIIILFIAFGINWVFKSFRYQKWLVAITAFIYLALLVNLAYLYTYQYPVYGAEGFFFSRRVLSEYLKRARKISDRPIYVFAQEPMAQIEQYIFYTNTLTKQRSKEIATIFKDKNYLIDGIKFDTDCPPAKALEENALLIYENAICHQGEDGLRIEDLVVDASEVKLTAIADLKDAGHVFKIYNDWLCQDVALGTYPIVSSLDEFEIAAMDDRSFCQNWIMEIAN